MNLFQVFNFTSGRIFKTLTLVFSGNIVAALLGFFAILIISRELSVSDFGRFNIAVSIMLMGSNIAALGIGVSMTKYVSLYLSIGKKAEADGTLKTTFILSIVISFIFALLLYSFADFLSIKIFHSTSLTVVFQISAFGVFGASLFNFLKGALYTYGFFKKAVIFQLIVDICKLGTVVSLFYFFTMNVFWAVAIFSISPFIGILLSIKQLLQKLFSKTKIIPHLISRIYFFSRWLFVSNVCNLIFRNIAIIMIANLLDSKSAGIYGLAHTLTYIFPIIIYSLSSVLLPEVSRFNNLTQVDQYIKKSFKIWACFGLSIIPFLFFSGKIILFFFGPRYLESVQVFNWLIIAYIFRTIESTISITLYSMNKPHVLALLDLTALIGMVVGCYLLIPAFGVVWPAILAFILNVSVIGFLTVYIFKQIKKGDIVFLDEEIVKPVQPED